MARCMSRKVSAFGYDILQEVMWTHRSSPLSPSVSTLRRPPSVLRKSDASLLFAVVRINQVHVTFLRFTDLDCNVSALSWLDLHALLLRSSRPSRHAHECSENSAIYLVGEGHNNMYLLVDNCLHPDSLGRPIVGSDISVGQQTNTLQSLPIPPSN